MLVKYEDEEYQFDLDDIDVAQARYIKRQTGLTLLGLEEGLEQVDPDCLVALYWLMLNQNGKTVDMNKVNFKLVKFASAIRDALLAEQEARAENPTEQATEAAPAPA